MLFEAPVLQAIEMSGFRGFRDPTRIPLGASAVVVSGPNGTGKTSFFDALQWLLLGRLPRLEAHAGRSKFDVIVNRWSGGGPASVAADLNISGAPVRIVRTGSGESNLLEWHGPEGVLRGSEAERRLAQALLGSGASGLGDVLLHTALLQQDAVRSLLEAEPKQRFTFLASLMGIDDLSRFTDAAKRRSDVVGRQASEQRRQYDDVRDEIEKLQARRQGLREQVISEDRLSELRKAVAGAAKGTDSAIVVSERALIEAGPSVTASRELDQLGSLCGELLRESERLRQAEETLVEHSPEDLASALNVVEALDSRLAGARTRDAETRAQAEAERRRRGELVQLASVALPLLGDRCPVCDQEIEADSVAEHLREVIEQQPGLKELESAAREALDGVVAIVAELEAARQHEREARRRADTASEVAASRSKWRQRVAGLSTWTELTLIDWASPSEADAGAIERVQRASALLLAPVQELARALSSSSSARQLDQVTAEIRAAEQRLVESQDLATRQSQRAEAAKSLVAAAARGAASVAERRLGRVQPLVDEIFARLDPHPAFTRLELRLDDYYRKGVAETITRDEAEDIEADPLLVFSSSQANVAALTWFLALSWSAGPAALPFLLLDDPLQSLDDVNVLGFADLCRRLREERQLIVSTHEPRLARLLERKLSARTGTAKTLHVRFTGWDRSGPTVTWEEIPDQHEEGQLRLVDVG